MVEQEITTKAQALEQEFEELNRFGKRVFGGWERRIESYMHFNLDVIYRHACDNPRAKVSEFYHS